MKKKLITAVAVLALGATMAIAGHGNGEKGHGRHARGKHQFGERMAAKLDLSEAQKQQIKDMQKSFRDENAAFIETFHKTKQDYREAKKSGDTARAEALRSTFESQQARMEELHKAEEQRIVTILTPDQRAKFDALKAEHAAKREQKQHNHKH